MSNFFHLTDRVGLHTQKAIGIAAQGQRTCLDFADIGLARKMVDPTLS